MKDDILTLLMIRRAKDLYARLDEQYPTCMRICRFLLSGSVSTGTDLVLLYLFTDILGIWYLTSAIVAFILAFGVSFTLMKFWTFSDHSRDGFHKQISGYFFVAVVNLTLNTFLVYTFVEWAGLYYLFAQIAAAALIAVESFFVYQHVIFRKNTAV
ncbi:MAG: GtrA family protein [Candidatus Kaiserbacteria bacterium]|nr:GtrA family protein [Candidatus Kaiserbacteria bacterium]